MSDFVVKSRIPELWIAGSVWGSLLGALSGALYVLVAAFPYALGHGPPESTPVLGVVVFSGIGLMVGSAAGLMIGSITGLITGMLLSLLLEQQVNPRVAAWITVVLITVTSGVAWSLVWMPMAALSAVMLYPLARSVRGAL